MKFIKSSNCLSPFANVAAFERRDTTGEMLK
jgi:hypothetical protein